MPQSKMKKVALEGENMFFPTPSFSS